MQLYFKTSGLRAPCTSEKLLRKEFGEKGMKKIRQRLDWSAVTALYILSIEDYHD